jgi:hypothetical protein
MLDDLTVTVRRKRQLSDIELMGLDEHRSERTVSIESLDTQHRTAVGVPEIMQPPVVRDGKASDSLLSLLETYASATLTDDEGNLSLVVQEMTTSWSCNRCSMC